VRKLAVVVLLLAGCGGGGTGPAPAPAPSARPGVALDLGTAPAPLSVRLEDPRDTVDPHFVHEPAAGLLFDVDTGQVLWRRHPLAKRPIASLTKMMTSLVVDSRERRFAKRFRVTKLALHTSGSEVGLFKQGMRIPIRTLLYGLMLPSGNDAARILAQGVAHGSIRRFVKLMNAEAATLGLKCSHFNTPNGLHNGHNHSCAADLAAIGREVLRRPRLAPIVGSRTKVLPFPIKGHKIFLYNHNPLLLQGYPGTTGVKTGFTDAAGPCFVATATRGAVKLGVVLLGSPDIDKQARRLLDAGFKAELG
jgi:D-alanyl-D-alanine carboxypeptidase (penicillin-binding protein 5/6)